MIFFQQGQPMKNRDSSILIRGGTTVSHREVRRQDILLTGETVAAAGHLETADADTVVEAEGLLVLPGAVDTHVHFNDEFMNTVSVHNYYTGTRAAAFGGVTSVVDFANQGPGTSLRCALAHKKKEAAGMTLVDWGVHPVITRADRQTLDEIPLMVKMGAPTIKCYMTYREEGLMMTEPDLRLILSRLKTAGGMLLVHAEDNEIIENLIPAMVEAGNTLPIFHARSRPLEAETRAITQVARLASETGGALFVVHMSAADGMEIVENARNSGANIHAETCTHYLVFTEEELERPDGIKWICSPPLRTKAVQDRLWQGLHEGRIAMVTSDDAAYSWEAKLYGKDRFDRCPNGIPGIETRLSILHSEGVKQDRIDLTRLVDLTSTTPAKLFGLWPKKGNLSPGADADIVIFDPGEEWTMGQDTLHMASDWSAYEGIRVKGRVKKVFSRGELIIDGDECLARRGRGRFLHRNLDFSSLAEI